MLQALRGHDVQLNRGAEALFEDRRFLHLGHGGPRRKAIPSSAEEITRPWPLGMLVART